MTVNRISVFTTSTGASLSRLNAFSTSTGQPESRWIVFLPSTGIATDRLSTLTASTNVAIDRSFGLNIGVAIKPACVVASTAALSLDGPATIDGVAVGGGSSERVLVKDQSDLADNGIYIATASGPWLRAPDCDGNKDLTPGSIVYVDRGAAHGRTFWVFNSSSTTPQVAIGTADITLSQLTVALSGVSSWMQTNILPLTSAASVRSVLDGAALSTDNTFVGTNVFSSLTSFSGDSTFTGALTQRWSNSSGSTQGPTFTLDRLSTAAASSGIIGAVAFTGRSTAVNVYTYANMQARVRSPSSSTLAGELHLQTAFGGSLDTRVRIGGGVVIGTGTDPGLGIVNALGGYQRAGVTLPLQLSYESAATTMALGDLYTFTHGLGSAPKLVQTRLRCLVAQHGYSTGDELYYNTAGSGGSGGNAGIAVYADSTSIFVRFDSDIIAIVPHKTSGASVTLDSSAWNIIINAWA